MAKRSRRLLRRPAHGCAGGTIAAPAPRGLDLAQRQGIMPIYDQQDQRKFRCWRPSAVCLQAMTSVQTTKLVGHPWSDLFNLVLDVKSYPQFVPHCHDVRLLSRKTPEPGITVIVSRMTVGFSAFEVGYSNRTTGDALGRKISIDAADGPLRYLSALWRFEPQDETHTRVYFSVNYEFSNPVLAAVASRVFAAMFGKILDAFERRAGRLLRNRAAAGAASPSQRRLTTS